MTWASSPLKFLYKEGLDFFLKNVCFSTNKDTIPSWSRSTLTQLSFLFENRIIFLKLYTRLFPSKDIMYMLFHSSRAIKESHPTQIFYINHKMHSQSLEYKKCNIAIRRETTYSHKHYETTYINQQFTSHR